MLVMVLAWRMQIACLIVQRRVDDMTHLFRCTGLHGELSTFNLHHISTGDEHEAVSMDSTPSGTSAVALTFAVFASEVKF